MKNKALYYNPSGQIDIIRLCLSYITSTLAALFLGYIYSVLTNVVPFVYINAGIAIGLGLLLGLTSRVMTRLSHNRNKRSQIIHVIILVLMTNYFQWTAYILFAYNGAIPTPEVYISSILWIFDPENLISAIIEVNKYGTWSIFGIPFKGIGLTTVWLIEFIFITVLPIVIAFKAPVLPFSERQNRWYKKYTLTTRFRSISMVGQLIEELSSDSVAAIENIGKSNNLRYTIIHLFHLENECKHYLTFEKVYVEAQRRSRKHSTTIINNFEINSLQADLILERFDNKREKFDVI